VNRFGHGTKPKVCEFMFCRVRFLRFCGTLCICFFFYLPTGLYRLPACACDALSPKRVFFFLPNTSWKNVKFWLHNLPFSFPIRKIKVVETQLSESFNLQWAPTNRRNKRNENLRVREANHVAVLAQPITSCVRLRDACYCSPYHRFCCIPRDP
jgi:hypothetical protein